VRKWIDCPRQNRNIEKRLKLRLTSTDKFTLTPIRRVSTGSRILHLIAVKAVITENLSNPAAS
jgi:hypothetical protein